MLNAGKLRHRITIQQEVSIEDSAGDVQDDIGSLRTEWQNVVTVWAEIAPLSGRDFIASQSEQHQIKARITIRHRSINTKQRVLDDATGDIYHIEAILPDKDSGREYLTLMCSEGVRYQ